MGVNPIHNQGTIDDDEVDTSPCCLQLNKTGFNLVTREQPQMQMLEIYKSMFTITYIQTGFNLVTREQSIQIMVGDVLSLICADFKLVTREQPIEMMLREKIVLVLF